MAMPRELSELIDAKSRELTAGGASSDEAKRVALRHAQHAGWYETIDGWKRIASDLRNKINVRKAVAQPDGKFLIQDVDIFYPNAVKGKDDNIVPFNAEDVQSLIQNTQAGVEDGNPVPLTRTHIRPEHKYTGVVIPAEGKGLNFRESPRGEGWARCDFADVDPAMVEDWRRGRIVGLSAGINADANGTNRRFGHIAALGGEPQALSRLPRTEIYAAEEIVSHAGQICFSAESTGASMFDHKKIKPSMSKLYAGFAAMEAGEPGAEDKLKEAHGEYCSDMQSSGAFAAPAEPDAALERKEDLMTEDEPATPAEEVPAYSASDLDKLTETFSATPDIAFGKLVGMLKSGVTASAGLAKNVAELRMENAKLKRERARSVFKSFADGLIGQGHLFSAEDAMSSYDQCGGNEGAIKAIRNLLAKTPKNPSLAQGEHGEEVFSAEDAGEKAPTRPGKNNAAAATAEVAKAKKESRRLQENFGNISFSGEDDFSKSCDAAVMIGEAATALQTK